MINSKKVLSTLTLGLLLTGSNTTTAEEDPSANFFTLSVTNETDSDCTPYTQELIKGIIYSTETPKLIKPYETNTFSILEHENLWGPDVILGYECGIHTIQFEVQQDLSVFEGHLPKVTELQSAGLSLTSTVEPSVVTWTTYIGGKANVVLRKNA